MKARGYTKETIAHIGMEDRGFPEFKVGDTITVMQRVKEGDKERLQAFEGDIIAMNNNGASSTFTVRKIGAHGVAIERIFPYYSPRIKEIKVIKHGDICRAKLYYIRDRIGKAARLKEKITTKEQRAATKEAEEVVSE